MLCDILKLGNDFVPIRFNVLWGCIMNTTTQHVRELVEPSLNDNPFFHAVRQGWDKYTSWHWSIRVITPVAVLEASLILYVKIGLMFV
jgi:hypothetical protein